MLNNKHTVSGAGLGLRRDFIEALSANFPQQVDFLEVAPENWLKQSGKAVKLFESLTAEHNFVCHGLSLSIGSPDPLDIEYIKQIKAFLDKYEILHYSEHLSFCSANGHLYDLMPIPFTTDAVDYVVDRISQVQDIIQRPLVLENVSYYTPLSTELTELEFTNQILKKSGAQLLLDVNNVYVNSINHGYDARMFIQALPSEKIIYGHVAGHYNEAENLIIDSHGADVIEQVWDLLAFAYQCHGVYPTLLERDFNIPSLNSLLTEVEYIHRLQQLAKQNDRF
ncbi:DUF692 domain-containing protein [Catenovulum sp. 2E275]|uniref:HvfB family MNIO-type RiPP peptide maturase n=1 Tax=Catenovulum sp. 2E275 TaxID=2980497 RepID=UPI0021D28C04|nr:DUF692 domain-containing protein [Catenovulum sp. 2E275]MCU4674983.1 DUF692 domain-containing protein [Catenovulum sp. 2E275]